MKLERFAAIIAAYGGAQARWPESERDAAAALLAASPEARAALAEAQRLDRLLDQVPKPALDLVPDMIAARAIATSQATAGRRHTRRGFWWFLPSASGLAAAAIAGFLVGWGEFDAPVTADASVDYSTYVASLELGDGLL